VGSVNPWVGLGLVKIRLMRFFGATWWRERLHFYYRGGRHLQSALPSVDYDCVGFQKMDHPRPTKITIRATIQRRPAASMHSVTVPCIRN